MIGLALPMTNQEIRQHIGTLIAHRPTHPTGFWKESLDSFDYVLSLPPDEFARTLRVHTHYLDGDSHIDYLFRLQYENYTLNYETLIQDVPQRYHLSAPDICKEPGYTVRGARVSKATMRFQHVVNAFYTAGVFNHLPARPTVLDIGGGYGSLIYFLSTLIGRGRYVIVDVPEVLYFSAIYLQTAYPNWRLYIYEPHTPIPDDCDLVLWPDYALDTLHLGTIDLATNVACFQEMNEAQVISYLDFLKRNNTQLLYSSNQDCQPFNTAGHNVTNLLKKYFSLEEIFYHTRTNVSAHKLMDLSLRKIFNRLQLIGTFSKDSNHEYLCRPLP